MKLHQQYLQLAAFYTLLVVLFAQIAIGQVPTEKTLLWELSGRGFAKPSYLFGTLHVICRNYLTVSETLRAKFGTTQQLYLELDFDDPNLTQAAYQGTTLSDRVGLKSLLSPQDYKTVVQYFQKTSNLTERQIATTKPFFLSALLYPSLSDCPTSSWERTLTKLAKRQTIEVLGLETIQQQITFFDKISLNDQALMLLSMIKNPDRAKQQMSTLQMAYRNQDVNVLYQIAAKASGPSGQYESALLTERNQQWIPIIEKAAQAKPSFFAVGAGHLGGENGVITLLRKAGYKVTPVF
jgi:uncharacterized protein